MQGADRYLAAIWHVSCDEGTARLSRIADYLRVRPPSASRALDRLWRDGLLEGRRPIRLSRDGLLRARDRVIAHQVAECWLERELGADWSSLHEDAERLAGALTPAQVLALWRHLGRPLRCPHGNAIPIAEDGASAASLSGGEMALTQAPAGTWRIVRVTEELEADPGALRALADLGVRPDRTIVLTTRTGRVATIRVDPGGQGNVPVAWLRGIRVTGETGPNAPPRRRRGRRRCSAARDGVGIGTGLAREDARTWISHS